MKTYICLLAVAIVVSSACDDGARLTIPTSPVAPPSSPTAPYTLSGQVFEVTATGRVPIEGVQVYCDGCGSPVGHTFERTDANGQYRFEWTPDGAMPLWVDKAGYALANQPVGSMPGYVVPTVKGDTRFDIELVRR